MLSVKNVLYVLSFLKFLMVVEGINSRIMNFPMKIDYSIEFCVVPEKT